MTVLDDTNDQATSPAADQQARLSLLEHPPGEPTTLDGAWWPRSVELTREIPQLAAALEARGIRLTRVVYHPNTWAVAPPKIWPQGRRVNLGWFREIDPNLVGLRTASHGRLELLVIPPDTEPTAAAQAMKLASHPGNSLTPTALLTAVNTEHS